MKILIASDKFKGSMGAVEACAAMERGLRALFPEAAIVAMPVADGGEGTAEAIGGARGGDRIEARARDALGRGIRAEFAMVTERDGGKLAVIEMSAASGLWRLDEGERDPRRATTYGTGLMMLEAKRAGAARIILGIGGSATNDGGSGMAEALGYRFYTGDGILLKRLPSGLEGLARIERPAGLVIPEVLAACDVTNPLLGERGATRIYGPQKGVREEEFGFFEGRLGRLADVVERDLGTDFRDRPGAGAAGGLGFGLLSFCGATLRNGFDLVAEIIGLDAAVRAADLVLTGEGRIDAQTAEGKAPAGVAALARKHGVPVVAFGGSASRLDTAGLFDAVVSIREGHPELSLGECMERGEELLEGIVRNSGRVLKKALQGKAGDV